MSLLKIPLRIYLCVVKLKSRYNTHTKVTLFAFVLLFCIPSLFCYCSQHSSSATDVLTDWLTSLYELESGTHSDVLEAGVASGEDPEHLEKMSAMPSSVTSSQVLHRTTHERGVFFVMHYMIELFTILASNRKKDSPPPLHCWMWETIIRKELISTVHLSHKLVVFNDYIRLFPLFHDLQVHSSIGIGFQLASHCA